MFVASDPLGLLHQQHAVALVLELRGIPGVHWHHTPVHMQLSHDGAASFQLCAEGVRRTFAQSQQTDENVLLWVLVRQEGFPATIGHIVASDQLHLQIRTHILEPPLAM